MKFIFTVKFDSNTKTISVTADNLDKAYEKIKSYFGDVYIHNIVKVDLEI